MAVDYSLRMLELAQENLADINIKKTFIRADIMSESFRKYIKKYVKNH
ncbi:class I SAM-dependent methyltransferase [bacterium]|nr:class I SAM-dependent methyltransferase [bacterium]